MGATLHRSTIATDNKSSPEGGRTGCYVRDRISDHQYGAQREVYSDGLLRLIMDFARQQRLIDGDELEAWSAEQRALSEQGRYFFGTMRYFFLASR